MRNSLIKWHLIGLSAIGMKNELVVWGWNTTVNWICLSEMCKMSSFVRLKIDKIYWENWEYSQKRELALEEYENWGNLKIDFKTKGNPWKVAMLQVVPVIRGIEWHGHVLHWQLDWRRIALFVWTPRSCPCFVLTFQSFILFILYLSISTVTEGTDMLRYRIKRMKDWKISSP